MKASKGLKGGRNEASLILLFLALWITLAFVIPFFIDRYLEKNYLTLKFENKIVPRNSSKEKVESPKGVHIEGKLSLQLPPGYTVTSETSAYEKSFSYRILNTSNVNKSWGLTIVSIEAVQNLDAVCSPGDCMRDFLTFPKEEAFRQDLEKIENDESGKTKTLGNQKYYLFTVPVDGDTGYIHKYITYINGIRVVFSAWTENKENSQEYDDFMEQVKIISILTN